MRCPMMKEPSKFAYKAKPKQCPFQVTFGMFCIPMQMHVEDGAPYTEIRFVRMCAGHANAVLSAKRQTANQLVSVSTETLIAMCGLEPVLTNQ
jgi:hypothetical protein